jgi:hypothetical protein
MWLPFIIIGERGSPTIGVITVSGMPITGPHFQGSCSASSAGDGAEQRSGAAAPFMIAFSRRGP